MFEDQTCEGDGEVGRDDDDSDGPPGCAAQGTGEDGGESGQKAGDGAKGGRVHRVDALPARDGWAALCAAAPELGRYGMLQVRWGKATKGSPPRRRNVASVMPWAVEAVEVQLRPLPQLRP